MTRPLGRGGRSFYVTFGCGGCLQIAPALEQVADRNAGKVKIGKVKVTANMDTAMRYQIRHLPTLLLFKSGDVVAQSIGALGATEIQKMLDLHI